MLQLVQYIGKYNDILLFRHIVTIVLIASADYEGDGSVVSCLVRVNNVLFYPVITSFGFPTINPLEVNLSDPKSGRKLPEYNREELTHALMNIRRRLHMQRNAKYSGLDGRGGDLGILHDEEEEIDVTGMSGNNIFGGNNNIGRAGVGVSTRAVETSQGKKRSSSPSLSLLKGMNDNERKYNETPWLELPESQHVMRKTFITTETNELIPDDDSMATWDMNKIIFKPCSAEEVQGSTKIKSLCSKF